MNRYNIGESSHRRRLMEQAQAAQQQGGGMLGPLGGVLGGTLGSTAGAALGTALLPGIGTAIGSGLGGAMGSATGAGRNPLDITAMDVGMGALTAGIPTAGATEAKEALKAAEASGKALDAAAKADLVKKAAETTSLMGKATGAITDVVSDSVTKGLDYMKGALGLAEAAPASQAVVDNAAMLGSQALRRQEDIMAPALMYAEGGEVTPITERLDALEKEREKQRLGPLAMLLLGGGMGGMDLGDYGALGGPLVGYGLSKLIK